VITRRRFLGMLLVGAGLAACRSGEPAAVVSTTTTTSTSTTTSTTTTTTAAPTTTTSTTATATTMPEPEASPVICREAWGAQPISGELIEHTIDQITVHHTAVVLDDNADAPAHIRGHQEFHQSRGWADLAYHFIIDAEGNIYEGRPVAAAGDTGTDYDPKGHLLVCCEGDFNQQEVPAAQYEALIAMLAWGAAEFAVDPGEIRGHRDVASTSCPGDNLYAFIADGTIAADVAAANVGTLHLICGTEAESLVSAIEA